MLELLIFALVVETLIPLPTVLVDLLNVLMFLTLSSDYLKFTDT